AVAAGPDAEGGGWRGQHRMRRPVRRMDHRSEPPARHRAGAGQLLPPVERRRSGHRGAWRGLRFVRLKGNAMRYDFSYIEALHAKARRERSEAIYEMLIAPLVGLFIREKTH